MSESSPLPQACQALWSPATPQDTPEASDGGEAHRQSCEIFSGKARVQPKGHAHFLMAGHGVQGM